MKSNFYYLYILILILIKIYCSVTINEQACKPVSCFEIFISHFYHISCSHRYSLQQHNLFGASDDVITDFDSIWQQANLAAGKLPTLKK
jgi:hypothetical protein